MSETKFTPGPWFVFTPSDYEGPGEMPGLGIENKDGASVVWYATAPEEGIENDADASLIAAVPELYEALKNLMELEKRGRIMPIGPEWDAARAALAKARGKTQ